MSLAINDESDDGHGHHLSKTARQIGRMRRVEKVRLRQRKALLQLIVRSMIEFGISQAELAEARRTITAHSAESNDTLALAQESVRSVKEEEL